MLWGGRLVLLPSISPSSCARGVPDITLHCWLQEELDVLCEPVEARNQPSYHHGNGPYNDVNITGCWFFKLPHKASWVFLGFFLGASQPPCIPIPVVLLDNHVILSVTPVLPGLLGPL